MLRSNNTTTGSRRAFRVSFSTVTVCDGYCESVTGAE